MLKLMEAAIAIGLSFEYDARLGGWFEANDHQVTMDGASYVIYNTLTGEHTFVDSPDRVIFHIKSAVN